MAKAGKRYMGQNFLISTTVAEAEAAHAHGKTVLEIGPGKGILTKELCKVAKRVIAVEKDTKLFAVLGAALQYKNLTLVNRDFFLAAPDELGLGKVDIVIANVPYSMSSKIIVWLREHGLEAVLCLQKEFVEHMLAREDTSSYSRLSVMCALSFRITEIMNVPRSSFRPIPGVDSEVIFLKPGKQGITRQEDLIINLLMQHKKKTLRNAILDSKEELGVGSKDISRFIEGNDCSQRVFKMSPERILGVAKGLAALQKL